VLSKPVCNKRDWGVFWRIIFSEVGYLVASFHRFSQNSTNLCFLSATQYSYNSESPYFDKHSEREGAVG